MAVMAHPARYRFTPTEEYALFTEFKAHGGQGVEVVTGSHSAAEYASATPTWPASSAWLASRGSDFHSPDESRVDLGALPDAAGRLTPVWSLLADRIHHPVTRPAAAAPVHPIAGIVLILLVAACFALLDAPCATPAARCRCS
jgi:hypothetical protein